MHNNAKTLFCNKMQYDNIGNKYAGNPLICFLVKGDNKMNDIKGLVNKPQFDTSVFQVGKAIHVKVSGNKAKELTFNFNKDCLIMQVGPLHLTVAYMSKEETETEEARIVVDDVSSGNVVITFLKEEKE
jgi:hypothetical protein